MAQRTFLIAAALMFPLICFGHEGHGYFAGWVPQHFFTSPFHAIPMVLAVGVTALLYFKKKKARSTPS